MAKWEELPIADRAAYMRIAVKNGYRDIRTIKEVYNKYDGGGSINKEKEVVLPEIVVNAYSAKDKLGNPLRDLVGNIIGGSSQEEADRKARVYALMHPNWARQMSYFQNKNIPGTMASDMETFNAITGGALNRLSLTQNGRFAYDALHGNFTSWFGNNGIVTNNFAAENPEWAFVINGAADGIFSNPRTLMKQTSKVARWAANKLDELPEYLYDPTYTIAHFKESPYMIPQFFKDYFNIPTNRTIAVANRIEDAVNASKDLVNSVTIRKKVNPNNIKIRKKNDGIRFIERGMDPNRKFSFYPWDYFKNHRWKKPLINFSKKLDNWSSNPAIQNLETFGDFANPIDIYNNVGSWQYRTNNNEEEDDEE